MQAVQLQNNDQRVLAREEYVHVGNDVEVRDQQEAKRQERCVLQRYVEGYTPHVYSATVFIRTVKERGGQRFPPTEGILERYPMVGAVVNLDFRDLVAVNTTVNCMRLQDLKQISLHTSAFGAVRRRNACVDEYYRRAAEVTKNTTNYEARIS